ncbi:flagellar hook-basal body complex protein FliE [Oxobacter pfennigii]|uniref:Flagellar hook-basal body complex protein FliE n=1 Tax=Oxobacter pfennigii TaxID=36849 RepID=A0A0P9AGW9_9CLOT|nr:flagellar hook-basal body complex protein FliE [Oxobacter pfennigii]KPU44686.1 flagellar hook-basal body complex protein FliE [Oxobacter pfennigii]
MRIDNVYRNINFDEPVKAEKKSGNTGVFGEYLKEAINSANEAQIKSDEETTKVMTGEAEDIHNALIAAEEARIQIELVMQVRNKLLEAYQEINRMQI